MTRAFNFRNESTWTRTDLDYWLSTRRGGHPKVFFMVFYNWTEDEYKQALRFTQSEIRKSPLASKKRLPSGTRSGKKQRLRVEIEMLQDQAHLFRNRCSHGYFATGVAIKPWFHSSQILSTGSLTLDVKANVTQRFISHANEQARRTKARTERRQIARWENELKSKIESWQAGIPLGAGP